MMKQFRKGHKDINKGEDARSNNKMMKMKKKKMLEKVKKNSKENSKGGDKGDRNSKYGEKQKNKMI